MVPAVLLNLFLFRNVLNLERLGVARVIPDVRLALEDRRVLRSRLDSNRQHHHQQLSREHALDLVTTR